ncbi:Phox-like protein [Periconia macrospinosa]|uniref:Endosomal/vacuolar adapter protein YPT35 n=1 Tax=Periconia macrospinosa TaxID=97972 RepID=A0A2V1EC05_9PLEO|nr:Phox-like protein [Periconia macrospinosa]
MEPARAEPVPNHTTAQDPDRHDGGEPATHRPERNSLVPPYWQRQENTNRLSSYSLENGSRPTPILLEDHTDEASDQHKALWAKHVSIDDYVIVGNSPAPAFGAYVVWTVTVETLDGGPMKIMKRFSEFDDLREKLVKSFPHAASSLPPLPPKSVVSRFRPRFLERRRVGLAYFLNCILLNPEFAGSPVLKEFLFS